MHRHPLSASSLLHIGGVQNQAAREKWQHREKKSRNWSSSWCLILDDGVVSSHPKPFESLDHQDLGSGETTPGLLVYDGMFRLPKDLLFSVKGKVFMNRFTATTWVKIFRVWIVEPIMETFDVADDDFSEDDLLVKAMKTLKKGTILEEKNLFVRKPKLTYQSPLR